MTGKLRWLKTVIRRAKRPRTHRECRHCGTTVNSTRDACPACGTTEIACYRLSE